jgi:hypothetical protein
MVPVYDIRNKYVGSRKRQPDTRVRNGQTFMRRASKIDSIVIHQTATPFPILNRNIKQYGSLLEASLERCSRAKCHAFADCDGWVALTRPLRSHVIHANRLNSTSLGLEIEGKYSGLRDDPTTAPNEAEKTTWNGPPMIVTDQVVAAGREAIKQLMELGRKEGMPIEFIYAHRQSSKTRRSDPGEELWDRVVEQYAIPVLGLKAEYERTWKSLRKGKNNDGRPIPKEWSPNGVGSY